MPAQKVSAQESRGSLWEDSEQELGLWLGVHQWLSVCIPWQGYCHVDGRWRPVWVALLLVCQWHPEQELRIQRTWACWCVHKRGPLFLRLFWPNPFKMSPYNQCSRAVFRLTSSVSVESFSCIAKVTQVLVVYRLLCTLACLWSGGKHYLHRHDGYFLVLSDNPYSREQEWTKLCYIWFFRTGRVPQTDCHFCQMPVCQLWGNMLCHRWLPLTFLSLAQE